MTLRESDSACSFTIEVANVVGVGIDVEGPGRVGLVFRWIEMLSTDADDCNTAGGDMALGDSFLGDTEGVCLGADANVDCVGGAAFSCPSTSAPLASRCSIQ